MKPVRSKSIEVDFAVNWKRFKVVVDNEDNDAFDHKMNDGTNQLTDLAYLGYFGYCDTGCHRDSNHCLGDDRRPSIWPLDGIQRPTVSGLSPLMKFVTERDNLPYPHILILLLTKTMDGKMPPAVPALMGNIYKITARACISFYLSNKKEI